MRPLSYFLTGQRWFAKSSYNAAKTTTWIWNIHADAHDFNSSRQIFSANLAHLAVVLIWLSGMNFHGAYFSNYTEWLNDPTLPHYAQQISNVANQSILNPIRVSSGFFNMWLAQGITNPTQLSIIAAGGLILALICILGSYYHMHYSTSFTKIFNGNLPSKLTSLISHHFIVLLGLGSLAWSGHLFHISLPVLTLLTTGVCTSTDLPPIHSLLLINTVDINNFSNTDFSSPAGLIILSATHHLFIGVIAILLGIFGTNPFTKATLPVVNLEWHNILGIQLFVTGSMSILYAHIGSLYSVYPYFNLDQPTVVSCFTHHMWIGGFFIVGSFAHLAISAVKAEVNLVPNFDNYVIKQRDIITGHLSWAVTFLGCHAFGFYIHNDTMLALGRPGDCFSDNAIQLLPIFSILGFSTISTANSNFIFANFELGTADFLVTHIHAFTIHTTLLILVKGCLYARSSRLVADKHRLGFRYPCDGPGRGGTCQISAWDHVFLGLFWMYNSISIVIFHFFWEYQSSLATVNQLNSAREVFSDFALNSTNVNGWLRNFLWSGAAQVLQSYGSSISAYGLTFLASHFVWALSLMFLFSGRGYWQELIESIVWAHNKLYLVPYIQPRALSITSGRAVGVTHYLLGGIGTTWSFFLSRSIAAKFG